MLYFIARAGHTMTQMDNKLIVCGGKGDTHQSKCLSSVEIYHLDTDQWIYTSPMKYDCWAMSDIGLFYCKQILAESYVEYIKQIMTGLEGNRQIYLPREIQDRLPKRFY